MTLSWEVSALIQDVLIECFDKLYDSGYRFIDSLDEIKVVEKQVYREVHTSVTHINFTYQGKVLTREQKKRIFNYAAFLMAFANNEASK